MRANRCLITLCLCAMTVLPAIGQGEEPEASRATLPLEEILRLYREADESQRKPEVEPPPVSATVHGLELEGRVLVDGMVAPVVGERPNALPLPVGDFIGGNHARRVTRSGRRDGVVIGTIRRAPQLDLRTRVAHHDFADALTESQHAPPRPRRQDKFAD